MPGPLDKLLSLINGKPLPQSNVGMGILKPEFLRPPEVKAYNDDEESIKALLARNPDLTQANAPEYLWRSGVMPPPPQNLILSPSPNPLPTPEGLRYTPAAQNPGLFPELDPMYKGQQAQPEIPKLSPNYPQLGENGKGVLADWLSKYNTVQSNSMGELTQQAPVDPLQDMYDLYEQLLQNISTQQAPAQDQNALRKLAEQQISAQYDPQIALLQQQMKERKDRYAGNKEELLDLWNSLSDSYNGDIGLSNNQYNAAQSEQSARAGNYEDGMRNNFNQSLDYMTEQFDKLGIGDTAAYTDPLLAGDLSEINALNQANNNSFDQYLASNELAAADYYRSMGNSAQMHGAEGVEDLMDELNYYLDDANVQMTGIKTNRNVDLQTALMQMMQQQQQQQAQSQQQMFDNLLKAGNFRVDLQGLTNKQNAANTSATPNYTSGLLGANQQFAALPNGQDLSGLFQELLQKQEFREGRFLAADNTIVKLTPEQAANYALQMAQTKGLDPQSTLAFMNAVYAYYGNMGR